MSRRRSEVDIELVLQRIRQLETDLDIAKGTIQMAVDRLGGEVENRPTHEGNFLQRIDQLRQAEMLLKDAVRLIPEPSRTVEAIQKYFGWN